MSFAFRVKNEISHNRNWTGRCRTAFLYGMLLCGKTFCAQSISLSTEHKGITRLYARLIFGAVPMGTSVTTQQYRGNFERSTFVARVDDQQDREHILAFFGYPPGLGGDQPLEIHRDRLATPEDRAAFVAGAFLACSNLSDPEKDYHLEFVLSQEALALQLQALLEELGVRANLSHRRGQQVVYCKDRQSIETLLAMMGASNAAMELMNVVILKEVRNNVNRLTNCETSNIEKMVSAATQQAADIRYLMEAGLYEGLEPSLRQTAQARLEHPDMSLRELGELLGVSRSGINHRLKKLGELARQAKNDSP